MIVVRTISAFDYGRSNFIYIFIDIKPLITKFLPNRGKKLEYDSYADFCS